VQIVPQSMWRRWGRAADVQFPDTFEMKCPHCGRRVRFEVDGETVRRPQLYDYVLASAGCARCRKTVNFVTVGAKKSDLDRKDCTVYMYPPPAKGTVSRFVPEAARSLVLELASCVAANLPNAARLTAREAFRAGLEEHLSRPECAARLASLKNLPSALRQPKTLYNLVQAAIALGLLKRETTTWSMLVRSVGERGALLEMRALDFEKWAAPAEIEAALETYLRDLFEDPGLAEMLAIE